MADSAEKALAKLKVIIDAEVAPIKKKIEEIKKSVSAVTDAVEEEVDAATADTKKQIQAVEKSTKEAGKEVETVTEETRKQIEAIKDVTKKVGEEVENQASGAKASVRAAMPQMSSAVKSHTDKMKNMFGGLGTIIKGAFAVIGLTSVIAFGKSCIDLGSDLAEVQNVVDVTFGDLSDKADAFAENAMDAYGLSETVAKQYMGTSGAMAKAFGFEPEDALAMSEAITGLTGDVASFYNLSSDTAFTKLKSIFTGETESLKELGVVMTQTALDEYALNNGFGKTTSEMSEQEKVLLRYQFVMSTLADASGDFERTSEGWANQTRVLQLRFEALKATIGQGLINAFTPVIRVINNLLAKLQVLASYFNQFTAAVFGQQESSTSAVVSDAADVTEDLSASMGMAADSAERLNKAVAGFDKLNIVNLGDSADSLNNSLGGLSSYMASDLGLNDISSTPPDIDTSKIEDKLRKLKELLAPMKDAAAGLWEELKRFGGFTWNNLQGFYDNFLVPIGQWAFGEDTGLTRLINVLTNNLAKIDWDALTASLNAFWKAIEPYAEQFGEGLIDFFDDLSGLAVDVINLFPGLLDKITGALNNGDPEKARAWGYAFGVVATGLIALNAVGGLFGLAAGLTATGAGIGIVGKAILIAGVAAGGFKIGQDLWEILTGEKIDLSWGEQFEIIKGSFTDGTWKDALRLWKDDILESLATVRSSLLDGSWMGALKMMVDDIIDRLKEKILGALGIVEEKTGNTARAIESRLDQMADNVTTNSRLSAGQLKGISSAAADMKNSLSRTLSKDNMTSAMSGVVAAADSVSGSFANTFTNNINGMLSNLEQVTLEPSSYLNIKASTNKLFARITKMPAMATGGVVNKATIAMVGEAGAEAVVPLENNTGWMSKVAQMISDRVNHEQSGSIDYDRLYQVITMALKYLNVTATVSKDDVNKAVVAADREYWRRTGNSQFAHH